MRTLRRIPERPNRTIDLVLASAVPDRGRGNGSSRRSRRWPRPRPGASAHDPAGPAPCPGSQRRQAAAAFDAGTGRFPTPSRSPSLPLPSPGPRSEPKVIMPAVYRARGSSRHLPRRRQERPRVIPIEPMPVAGPAAGTAQPEVIQLRPRLRPGLVPGRPPGHRLAAPTPRWPGTSPT